MSPRCMSAPGQKRLLRCASIMSAFAAIPDIASDADHVGSVREPDFALESVGGRLQCQF